tara:strand:- start:13 stop:861 length:849 start_codon:yes stop_codon:yes gene_type:complete
MIPPILVITTHGWWDCKEDKGVSTLPTFKAPIGGVRIQATKMGVPNYLDPKIASSVLPLIQQIIRNLSSTTEEENRTEIVNKLSNDLRSLDMFGAREGAVRTRQEPFAREDAKNDDEISEGARLDDGTSYLSQREIEQYAPKTFDIGDIISNKTYGVYSNENSSDFNQKYNNRILLYTFNKDNDIEDIKDLIPSWNPLVNVGPVQAAIKEHRNMFSITLKDILEKLKVFGIEDVIIIDLGCNSIDTDASEGLSERGFRAVVRAAKGGSKKRRRRTSFNLAIN